MGAAHTLAQDHRVVLFEADPAIGGHARTRMGGPNRDQPVDTGFIVFNYANYPHLAALFGELDVPVSKSNMSFGASIGGGRFEYGLASFNAIFAQKKNLLSPKFLRMMRDILHFNANALRVAQDRSLTIRDFLTKLGTGDYFRDYYLLPLTGAIWSTPTEKIMDFPAHAMMQFMENHALLHHTGQHQWYTVEGGSIEYVTRLQTSLEQRGVDIRTNAPIKAVRRDAIGVCVMVKGGDWEHFDEVVFATHSDDTLRMLTDPSETERDMLGAVKYQPNDVVFHSDASIMPMRRSVWSSWNYTEGADKTRDAIDLTYWMNKLQPSLTRDEFFVTLNTQRPIREDLIWDQTTLRHPVYDLAALAAQETVAKVNGTNRTWFCGAWMKNGFHEDGLASAVRVAEGINLNSAAAVAAQ
jgi:predicted NAD/FAD-binding protein